MFLRILTAHANSHVMRALMMRALGNKMKNDRANDHCYSFAWIYDLGRSVTPFFF